MPCNAQSLTCTLELFLLFLQEVLEFNKFVEESGGHEHRWPLEDHNLFLKLRNKHKNEVELATKLHLLLPGHLDFYSITISTFFHYRHKRKPHYET